MRKLIDFIRQKKAIVIPAAIAVLALLIAGIVFAVVRGGRVTETVADVSNDNPAQETTPSGEQTTETVADVSNDNPAQETTPSGEQTTETVADVACEYRIERIELDDYIFVTVSTADRSLLKVDFTDEKTGEEYGHLEIELFDKNESDKYLLDYPSDLPPYYQIVGYITDSDGKVLSAENYICVQKTETYQKIWNAQPSDFPEGDVVYLHGGFGVYSDRVQVISGGDFLREDGDTFVFRTTDAVRKLRKGDLIGTDQNSFALKIGSIDTAGGETKIVPADDVQLSDFYDFFRLDTVVASQYEREPEAEEESNIRALCFETLSDVGGAQAAFLLGETEAEESEIHEMNENDISIQIDPERDYSKHFKKSIGSNVTADAGVDATLQTKIVILYDHRFYAQDYFYSSCIATLNLSLGASVYTTDDVTVNKEIELPEISVQTGIVGLKVFCGVTPYFDGKLSATAQVKGNFNLSGGFEMVGANFRKIASRPGKSLNLMFHGETELAVGIRLDVGLRYLGMLSCDIDLDPRFVLSGQADAERTYGDTEEKDVEHKCDLCLSGDAKFVLTSTIGAEVNILNAIQFESERLVLLALSRSVQVFDGQDTFYVSLINGKDSCFGGKAAMGGGECPNKQYRTKLVGVLADGTVVDGLSFDVLSDPDRSPVCHVEPGETCMLYPISYFASVTYEAKTKACPFTVEPKPGTVEVPLDCSILNVRVVDEDGQPVEGWNVRIAEIGKTVYEGIAPCSVSVTPGEYDVDASFPSDHWGFMNFAIRHVQVGTEDEDVVFVCPKRVPVEIRIPALPGEGKSSRPSVDYVNGDLFGLADSDESGTVMLPCGTNEIRRIMVSDEDKTENNDVENIYMLVVGGIELFVDATTERYTLDLPGTFKRCRVHLTCGGGDVSRGTGSFHEEYKYYNYYPSYYGFYLDDDGYSPWINVYYENGYEFGDTVFETDNLGRTEDYEVDYGFDGTITDKWYYGRDFTIDHTKGKNVWAVSVPLFQDVNLKEKASFSLPSPDQWNDDTFEFNFTESQITVTPLY